MNYLHLEKLAAHLASTGILCLRFTCRTRNFQYRKECFTAVVEFLRNYEEFPVRMCVIAGRSMGARVAAEVGSNSSLTTDFVYGVACLSYPLHPPRKTSERRVSPLLHLGVPVLFISGRKDPFCRADLMENATLNRMANDWTMHWVDGADHELKVNGRVNNEIISNMCEWFVQWCQSVFMAERS
ncbi:testis-expressed protein 30-like [Porites lutea]|uniref:testis-expressed protein 30-like n=1 Tax=Porites lutea TaxID=51062 RepID=UPI003CC50F58